MNKFLKHIKEPYVIILIGPPLSGKTTWIKDNFDDENVTIISMDQIILDLYGSDDDYNTAYKQTNQKDLKANFRSQMINASKNDENVIVDMTHLVRKRRVSNLSYFPKHYYKLGIIFPFISDEEYEKRNKSRVESENKNITPEVFKMMLGQYQPIDRKEEGFNKIISL